MKGRDFFAKSYPRETIQEHTDKLLENFILLQEVYPEVLSSEIRRYLLKTACIYHDLGKIERSFQEMILGKNKKSLFSHGPLSLLFLNKKEQFTNLEKFCKEMDENKKKEYKKSKLKILANAIAYHHDRETLYFPEGDNVVNNLIEELKIRVRDFSYDKIENIQVKNLSKKYFSPYKRIYPPENLKTQEDREKLEEYYEYIFIKGLLNRLDYAASAHIPVEVENDFLEEKMKKLLSSWKEKNKESKWNELQEYAIKNREKNLVVVAQTGMGKTEAGLLWLGNRKGFFILPLKTAINAIYKRVQEIVTLEEKTKKDKLVDKIGLLHSDTLNKYLEFIETEDLYENVDLDSYYDATKQLSLPLTICTLDQLFYFVFRPKGFELQLATLSYSNLIIDEIQMYSSELLAYLIRGLADITRFGGKFIILTATFPRIVEDLLKKEGVDLKISQDFTKEDLQIRHSVKVIESLIDTDLIVKKYNKNKILVICNTVKECQKVAIELREKLENPNEVNIFHAKFIKRDKDKKEQEILELGRKENKNYGIWVTTQIVEASLDIDFDLLFTELSDLNGLFQRMGRCYRNRAWRKGSEKYNVYVFIGDEKNKNTGINYVIDKYIYSISREKVKKELKGKLKEKKKMQFIAELYTTENLKDSEYYNKIIKGLEFLRLCSPYEKTRQKVAQEFRGIKNENVIPKPIYLKYRDEIDKNLEILKSKYNKNMSKDERIKFRRDKIRAKKELYDLTVGIKYYDKDRSPVDKVLEINIREKVEVVECHYNEDIGFCSLKKSEMKVEKHKNFI